MASNFKISGRHKNATMEIRLAGDFDGTSACELLNFLAEHCDGAARVFVNTKGLKEIYPFGVETFQNNLYLLKGRGLRLFFTGKDATSIAPEPHKLLWVLP